MSNFKVEKDFNKELKSKIAIQEAEHWMSHPDSEHAKTP
jgi:hypothetical protein